MRKIDKIELIKLYDIYGKLLTAKQSKTFEYYYLDDLSLREIAENTNISFQAVRDSLEVSKKQLLHFEETIGMKKIKEELQKLYDDNKETIEKSKLLDILNKLK